MRVALGIVQRDEEILRVHQRADDRVDAAQHVGHVALGAGQVGDREQRALQLLGLRQARVGVFQFGPACSARAATAPPACSGCSSAASSAAGRPPHGAGSAATPPAPAVPAAPRRAGGRLPRRARRAAWRRAPGLRRRHRPPHRRHVRLPCQRTGHGLARLPPQHAGSSAFRAGHRQAQHHARDVGRRAAGDQSLQPRAPRWHSRSAGHRRIQSAPLPSSHPIPACAPLVKP